MDLSFHVTLKHIPLSLWLAALSWLCGSPIGSVEVCKLKPFSHWCFSCRRILASASTFHFHPHPASIPGKLGSKLPKVPLSQKPSKRLWTLEQNGLDWTGLDYIIVLKSGGKRRRKREAIDKMNEINWSQHISIILNRLLTKSDWKLQILKV